MIIGIFFVLIKIKYVRISPANQNDLNNIDVSHIFLFKIG